VGILVRAYSTGVIARETLEEAIDALSLSSSLFMSRTFRTYVRNLITNLS